MGTILINGLGVSATIEVADGENYIDALRNAGFADPEELDVIVDGAETDGFDPVAPGATVTATPKNANLG